MGFFRVSGFKHLWDIIAPSDNPSKIDEFSSIRLLVGIEADKFAHLASNFALNSHDETKQKAFFKAYKDEFCARQSDDLNQSPYSPEVEQGFESLVSALTSKKLQIRIVKNKATHAKFYIFSTKPTYSKSSQTPRYNGSLIVGSSNLSEAGLAKNYEFNLESQQSDDLHFALCEFKALWDKAVPLLNESDFETEIEEFKRQIKEQSFLKECSVKDIYYKLLIEYFGENRIKIDESLKGLFPRHFAKPDYQLAAISEGLDKLEKYNGFFLSDVVGLGKTLIACIIAKKFELQDKSVKTLIVCPASLKSSWEWHLKEVNLSRQNQIVSYDMLEKEVKNPREFSLVIVDESHNFIHTNIDRYTNLQNICTDLNPKNERKKVILLSATPQKNSPKDIENQLCLFQDKYASNIENISNLEEFFSPLNKEFDKIKDKLKKSFNQEDENALKEAKEKLKKISTQIAEKILRFVMVRRTRKDIESTETFAANLKEQKISFPKISSPKELLYKFDRNVLELVFNTIYLLNPALNEKSDIGEFGYFRYLIYKNLNASGKAKYEENYKDKQNFLDNAQELVGLMQTLMFKRLESSFCAFKSTLKTQIKSIKAFLKMFENGSILIPKKMSNLYRFYDEILADETDDKLEEYLKTDKAFELEKSDFVATYEKNLRSDLKTLETLLLRYESVKCDYKLERLKRQLTEFAGKKIVIFTEAKDTAGHLEHSLNQIFKGRVLSIDASNREQNAQKIRENFDANLAQSEQKDDIDILISTDTLAEGVNLHRSNIIINYDSPWSATALMQRLGRINRIGTPHERIEIYNFKPSEVGELILQYKAKAYQKLQSFHFTFGEDSAIYDENEEFDTKRLFSLVEQEQSELSPQTPFLDDIKKLYHNDSTEFERIKNLKIKSRTFINGLEKCFCYLKNKKGSNYFYETNSLTDETQICECDFLKMANFLKEHFDDKPLKISTKQRQRHYESVRKILEFHKEKFAPKPAPSLFESKSSKNPKITKARLKISNLQPEFLNEAQKELIIAILEKGTLTHLAKKIDKARTKEDYEEIFALCKDKNPSLNESLKESDYEPQIELLLTRFEKEN